VSRSFELFKVASLRAKIMDRLVIAERNVIRADIMVAPLDSIHDIIQTYHWGYLHNCACVVLTRLVRLFYANLEVVQDDDHGMILQSSMEEHVVNVDPFLDDLREFFHAVSQGEECATTIRISALTTPHRMLAKIVQHSLWPVVRCSDLILKMAQFVYAICLRLPFCLCKHILGAILEARDEGNIGVSPLANYSLKSFCNQAILLLESRR